MPVLPDVDEPSGLRMTGGSTKRLTIHKGSGSVDSQDVQPSLMKNVQDKVKENEIEDSCVKVESVFQTKSEHFITPPWDISEWRSFEDLETVDTDSTSGTESNIVTDSDDVEGTSNDGSTSDEGGDDPGSHGASASAPGPSRNDSGARDNPYPRSIQGQRSYGGVGKSNDHKGKTLVQHQHLVNPYSSPVFKVLTWRNEMGYPNFTHLYDSISGYSATKEGLPVEEAVMPKPGILAFEDFLVGEGNGNTSPNSWIISLASLPIGHHTFH
ncbi:hypothetical protein MMC11_003920 [Xylographa trunciseda]|nr:hypothetical protein [Xylographa trunciseda]